MLNRSYLHKMKYSFQVFTSLSLNIYKLARVIKIKHIQTLCMCTQSTLLKFANVKINIRVKIFLYQNNAICRKDNFELIFNCNNRLLTQWWPYSGWIFVEGENWQTDSRNLPNYCPDYRRLLKVNLTTYVRY